MLLHQVPSKERKRKVTDEGDSDCEEIRAAPPRRKRSNKTVRNRSKPRQGRAPRAAAPSPQSELEVFREVMEGFVIHPDEQERDYMLICLHDIAEEEARQEAARLEQEGKGKLSIAKQKAMELWKEQVAKAHCGNNIEARSHPAARPSSAH